MSNAVLLFLLSGIAAAAAECLFDLQCQAASPRDLGASAFDALCASGEPGISDDARTARRFACERALASDRNSAGAEVASVSTFRNVRLEDPSAPNWWTLLSETEMLQQPIHFYGLPRLQDYTGLFLNVSDSGIADCESVVPPVLRALSVPGIIGSPLFGETGCNSCLRWSLLKVPFGAEGVRVDTLRGTHGLHTHVVVVPLNRPVSIRGGYPRVPMRPGSSDTGARWLDGSVADPGSIANINNEGMGVSRIMMANVQALTTMMAQSQSSPGFNNEKFSDLLHDCGMLQNATIHEPSILLPVQLRPDSAVADSGWIGVTPSLTSMIKTPSPACRINGADFFSEQVDAAFCASIRRMVSAAQCIPPSLGAPASPPQVLGRTVASKGDAVVIPTHQGGVFLQAADRAVESDEAIVFVGFLTSSLSKNRMQESPSKLRNQLRQIVHQDAGGMAKIAAGPQTETIVRSWLSGPSISSLETVSRQLASECAANQLFGIMNTTSNATVTEAHDNVNKANSRAPGLPDATSVRERLLASRSRGGTMEPLGSIFSGASVASLNSSDMVSVQLILTGALTLPLLLEPIFDVDQASALTSEPKVSWDLGHASTSSLEPVGGNVSYSSSSLVAAGSLVLLSVAPLDAHLPPWVTRARASLDAMRQRLQAVDAAYDDTENTGDPLGYAAHLLRAPAAAANPLDIGASALARASALGGPFKSLHAAVNLTSGMRAHVSSDGSLKIDINDPAGFSSFAHAMQNSVQGVWQEGQVSGLQAILNASAFRSDLELSTHLLTAFRADASLLGVPNALAGLSLHRDLLLLAKSMLLSGAFPFQETDSDVFAGTTRNDLEAASALYDTAACVWGESDAENKMRCKIHLAAAGVVALYVPAAPFSEPPAPIAALIAAGAVLRQEGISHCVPSGAALRRRAQAVVDHSVQASTDESPMMPLQCLVVDSVLDAFENFSAACQRQLGVVGSNMTVDSGAVPLHWSALMRPSRPLVPMQLVARVAAVPNSSVAFAALGLFSPPSRPYTWNPRGQQQLEALRTISPNVVRAETPAGYASRTLIVSWPCSPAVGAVDRKQAAPVLGFLVSRWAVLGAASATPADIVGASTAGLALVVPGPEVLLRTADAPRAGRDRYSRNAAFDRCSVNIVGLPGNTTYFFRVAAVSAAGVGLLSSLSSGVFLPVLVQQAAGSNTSNATGWHRPIAIVTAGGQLAAMSAANSSVFAAAVAESGFSWSRLGALLQQDAQAGHAGAAGSAAPFIAHVASFHAALAVVYATAACDSDARANGVLLIAHSSNSGNGSKAACTTDVVVSTGGSPPATACPREYARVALLPPQPRTAAEDEIRANATPVAAAAAPGIVAPLQALLVRSGAAGDLALQLQRMLPALLPDTAAAARAATAAARLASTFAMHSDLGSATTGGAAAANQPQAQQQRERDGGMGRVLRVIEASHLECEAPESGGTAGAARRLLPAEAGAGDPSSAFLGDALRYWLDPFDATDRLRDLPAPCLGAADRLLLAGRESGSSSRGGGVRARDAAAEAAEVLTLPGVGGLGTYAAGRGQRVQWLASRLHAELAAAGGTAGAASSAAALRQACDEMRRGGGGTAVPAGVSDVAGYATAAVAALARGPEALTRFIGASAAALHADHDAAATAAAAAAALRRRVLLQERRQDAFGSGGGGDYPPLPRGAVAIALSAANHSFRVRSAAAVSPSSAALLTRPIAAWFALPGWGWAAQEAGDQGAEAGEGGSEAAAAAAAAGGLEVVASDPLEGVCAEAAAAGAAGRPELRCAPANVRAWRGRAVLFRRGALPLVELAHRAQAAGARAAVIVDDAQQRCGPGGQAAAEDAPGAAGFRDACVLGCSHARGQGWACGDDPRLWGAAEGATSPPAAGIPAALIAHADGAALLQHLREVAAAMAARA